MINSNETENLSVCRCVLYWIVRHIMQLQQFSKAGKLRMIPNERNDRMSRMYVFPLVTRAPEWLNILLEMTNIWILYLKAAYIKEINVEAGSLQLNTQLMQSRNGKPQWTNSSVLAELWPLRYLCSTLWLTDWELASQLEAGH